MMTVIAARLAYAKNAKPADGDVHAITARFGAVSRRDTAWEGRSRAFREFLYLTAPDRAERLAKALLRYPGIVRAERIDDPQLLEDLLMERRRGGRRAPGRANGADRRRAVAPLPI